VLTIQHLVAGAGVGAHQQRQQLVRAGAANDAFGVEIKPPAQRAAQLSRAAVRVAVHGVGMTAQRFNRLGAGAERPFVGGEANIALVLAADVSGDVENAGTGNKCGHGESFRLAEWVKTLGDKDGAVNGDPAAGRAARRSRPAR